MHNQGIVNQDALNFIIIFQRDPIAGFLYAGPADLSHLLSAGWYAFLDLRQALERDLLLLADFFFAHAPDCDQHIRFNLRDQRMADAVPRAQFDACACQQLIDRHNTRRA